MYVTGVKQAASGELLRSTERPAWGSVTAERLGAREVQEGGMSVYTQLLYSRNQHNIVKQMDSKFKRGEEGEG